MPDVLIEPEGTHEPHLPKTPRKAALAAWIGSALEYYDFFIYGTAAAVLRRHLLRGIECGNFLAFATFGYVPAPRRVRRRTHRRQVRPQEGPDLHAAV